MSSYLSYDRYLGLGGPEMDYAAFTLAQFSAAARVDRMTFGRVQHMETVPEEVEMCVFSLMQVESKLGVVAQTENPVVTSFSTDGYQETYGNVQNTSDASRTMDDMVKHYLYGVKDDYGTPLLYRGCEA